MGSHGEESRLVAGAGQRGRAALDGEVAQAFGAEGASGAEFWANLALLSSGNAEPSREKLATAFYPMSGTSIRAYRFEFTYGARYASLSPS